MKPFKLPGKSLRPSRVEFDESDEELEIKPSTREQRAEIISMLPVIQSQSTVKTAEQLRSEGCILASNGNFVEALKVFNAGTFHYKSDGFMYELQSQAHLALGNHWQAVHAAEKAVSCLGFVDWFDGYITLGRAQREVGEVLKAVESYEKALQSPAIRADETTQEEYAELLELKNQLLQMRAQKMMQMEMQQHNQQVEMGEGKEEKDARREVNACFANLSLRGTGPVFFMPPPPL